MAGKQESTVRTCSCANAWQDKEYGNGRRLHNMTKKGQRCTVCGTEHIGGGFEGNLVPKAKKVA